MLKQLIIDFHGDDLPQLISRQIDIPSVPKAIRKAFVFAGIRRSGKTYLAYQHMSELLASGLDKTKLCYINFEDDRLSAFAAENFQEVLDAYFELYPEHATAKDVYFYFDEIQNIEYWEKFIRRLLDKESMQIFITGSSAKALSKEISTNLRGRHMTTEVFPLSFQEYLSYHGVKNLSRLTTKQRALVMHLQTQYLQQGGFPETLFIPSEQHRLLLQSYVNTVIYRDVVERYDVSNAHMVKQFLLHCLQNMSAPLSINKVYQAFKSMGEVLGKNSLYEYLGYFEDAYLLFAVPIFQLSLRKRQVNPKKLYCVDPGIISAYAMSADMVEGALFENAVFNALRRRSEDIYYYKTPSGREVDFVVQDNNGRVSLYQACINMKDSETREREVQALLEASQTLAAERCSILTIDHEETIKIGKVVVHVIPFWKHSF